MKKLISFFLCIPLILNVAYAVDEYKVLPQTTISSAKIDYPLQTIVPPDQYILLKNFVKVEPRSISIGDYGDDVLELKRRMQKLGYFKKSSSLSNKFTQVTSEYLIKLQLKNGLEPTGIATAKDLDLIYSDECLGPNNKTLMDIEPTPIPFVYPIENPNLPKLNSEGFLADTATVKEFIYQNENDGNWYYISKDLFIEIRRYSDKIIPLVWYETEIRISGSQILNSYESENERRKLPIDICREHDYVLAISDDYYDFRVRGIAIRNGEIKKDRLKYTKNVKYPNGDTLTLLSDGSMRADYVGEYSAEEFINMGAVHVLNFGPVLVKDGILGELVRDDKYMNYREPRNAIGMIEANHYIILTVDGRVDNSNGAYLYWLANRMMKIGVTEALNLDGGGTTALVFMGEQINHPRNSNNVGTTARAMNSMLYFGESESVLPPRE